MSDYAKLNPDVVNEMKDMMGDSFGELINNYISASSKSIEILKSEMVKPDNYDYPTIRLHVHSMKSSSAQIGFEEYSKLAAKIELDIINNNYKDIISDLKVFTENFASVLNEVKKLINSSLYS